MGWLPRNCAGVTVGTHHAAVAAWEVGASNKEKAPIKMRGLLTQHASFEGAVAIIPLGGK